MQSRQWTSINNLWNIQFNSLLWTLNNFHQAMQFNSKQMVYVYRCNAMNAVTRSLDVSSTSVYTWLDFNASCLSTSALLALPPGPRNIHLIVSPIFPQLEYLRPICSSGGDEFLEWITFDWFRWKFCPPGGLYWFLFTICLATGIS